MSEVYDDFLGGKLSLCQGGFRAGHDSVLLGTFAPLVKEGGVMLDVGCGVGTVLWVYGRRVCGVGLCGVEREEEALVYARKNGLRNGYGERAYFVRGDILRGGGGLKFGSVDGVMMNPPYWDDDEGLRRADSEEVGARVREADVGDYIDVCVKLLKPGGWLSVVYPARKVSAVLSVMCLRLGCVEVVPVHGKWDRGARAMLLRGKKLSKRARGDVHWCRPLVMHEDDGSPSAEAELVTIEGRFPEGIVRR